MVTYPELVNKRVLITGAASGIGLSTVKKFVNAGSFVIAVDKNKTELNNNITEKNKNIEKIVADVACREVMDDVFKSIDGKYGGLDVVIANAGISIRHNFIDITFEEWKKVIDVNLNGVFNTVQPAARLMLRDSLGVILVMGSTNAINAHKYYADYNASKAAVILLAKTMALELAPLIRVNSVCPGYVLTPMQRAEYTDEMLDKVNLKIPLGRHADPDEIAELFAFLSSDQSRYITGQHIVIDGGETA